VEHIEVSDEETNTTRESSFLTVYSDSEVVVHADEVDPIAEADVYLAYGRDQQAEEVLIDGMTKFPDRDDIKLKLLTIYRKRKDVSSFETLAEELYPTDSAASRDTWELVARMGRKLSPGNPLFNDALPGIGEDGLTAAGAGDTLTDGVEAAGESPEEADSGMMEYEIADETAGTVTSEEENQSAGEEVSQGGELYDELEFDLQDEMEQAKSGTQDVELDSVAAEVSAVLDTLDLDDDSEYVLSVDETDDESDPAETDVAVESIDLELEDIDETVVDVTEENDSISKELPVGLSNERSEVIEFTPELTARREQLSARNQSASKDNGIVDDSSEAEKNEFETQIELAKVFIELGDKDGARKILSEVINDGERDHRLVAEELMSAINE
jgi:pilus assembly protein FimV